MYVDERFWCLDHVTLMIVQTFLMQVMIELFEVVCDFLYDVNLITDKQSADYPLLYSFKNCSKHADIG